MFSTDFNREGIRVGTAICTVVRKPERQETPTVRFRNFWGSAKRADLLASLEATDFDAGYAAATPTKGNRLSFKSEDVGTAYAIWPTLAMLSKEPPITGFKENRGFVLLDSDREKLARRMQKYFDTTISWDDLKAGDHGLTKNAARFDAKLARDKLLAEEPFNPDRIVRYVLRPFEVKWAYYTPVRPIWNEPRPSLYRHLFTGNRSLVSRPDASASPEGNPFYIVGTLADFDFIRGHSYHFPIQLSADLAQEESMFATDGRQLNMSESTVAYLTSLDVDLSDARTASLIWMHALAIGYAPAYLSENADGIQRDWPRIPLPVTRAALEASAALGERVATLLDTEAGVPGVTTGTLSPLLRTVGGIGKVGGGNVNPAGDDLALTVNWGYAGQKAATMPGRGKTEARAFADAEQRAIVAEADGSGQTPDALTALLGGDTLDIYLNPTVFWQNVPAAVWDFYIGGYQVMKKWLSYRERDLLGRPLKVEEAKEVTAMARRLTALVLLRPQLDANYTAVAAATYAWPKA